MLSSKTENKISLLHGVSKMEAMLEVMSHPCITARKNF